MHRPVLAIKIQAVEGCIGGYPIGHFAHILIYHDEIHRCSQTQTDGLPFGIKLMCGMLIEPGCDAPWNMSGQFG